MISKGTQYLTAAGFGNIRVTAASIWKAWIMCPWLLSGAARQAIMVAFGADGAAVIKATNAYLNGIAATDQSKAQALAGFINEDPMMVCSLGLQVEGVTMPIRWLVTTNGARINPNLNTAADTEYEIMVMPTSMTQETSFIGNRTANNLIQFYGNQFRIVPNGSWTIASGVTVVANGIYTAKLTRDGFWTNGEKRLTLSATIGTGQPIWIFQACNGSSYHASPLVGGISYAKIYSSVGNREMYTFIRKIDGVDKLGMIDVLSNTFYQNAGSGAFSIDYRLPDGTPWTPPTP